MVSGTGAGAAVVAENTGDAGDGAAVTWTSVGYDDGTAVAWTAVCAGVPVGEGIIPDAGELVRDV